MCSKVGDDRLGNEALRRIDKKGISLENIQLDKEEETGFVEVEMTDEGEPSYDIIEPVAWDFIEITPGLKKLVEDSWGLVFGTLAQRNEFSSNALRQLWDFDCKKILDLNLRSPYDDKEIVHDSLKVADIVKMNDEELIRMKEWFSLPGGECESVEKLSQKFSCSLVCITKGANGASLYQDGHWFAHKGFKVQAKDSVGAGDAFFAAFIYGIQHGKKGKELLKYANAAGSFVAQKRGATPEYDIYSVEEIMTS
jgi:fructokinase